mgnify:CR=1 FL=1
MAGVMGARGLRRRQMVAQKGDTMKKEKHWKWTVESISENGEKCVLTGFSQGADRPDADVREEAYRRGVALFSTTRVWVSGWKRTALGERARSTTGK